MLIRRAVRELRIKKMASNCFSSDEGSLALSWVAARAAENAQVFEFLGGTQKVPVEMLQRLKAVVEDNALERTVSAETFVRLVSGVEGIACLDVRSPAEFEQGHIPGAVQVPLFTNEERHTVGLTYSRQGKGPAMVLGFKCVKPKLASLVEAATAAEREASSCFKLSSLAHTQTRPTKKKTVAVHCWRGGMRSKSVAWWLTQHGFDVVLLEGGYKAYREWAMALYSAEPPPPISPPLLSPLSTREEAATAPTTTAAAAAAAATPVTRELSPPQNPIIGSAAERPPLPPRVCIVGGRTGSGKTRVLHSLRNQFGCKMLDLEGLANHRGSSFGFVAQAPQPTSEQYQNDCAEAWQKLVVKEDDDDDDGARVDLKHKDPVVADSAAAAAAAEDYRRSCRGWIFVEDEAPNVGRCSVPPLLYLKMRAAPLVVKVVVPQEARLTLLVEDYASVEAQEATEAWEGKMAGAIRGMEKRLGGAKCAELLGMLEKGNVREIAEAMLAYYDKLYDRHVGNSGGTGNGAGERAGLIVEAAADPTAVRLCEDSLAATIIGVVLEFEEEERRAAREAQG